MTSCIAKPKRRLSFRLSPNPGHLASPAAKELRPLEALHSAVQAKCAGEQTSDPMAKDEPSLGVGKGKEMTQLRVGYGTTEDIEKRK